MLELAYNMLKTITPYSSHITTMPREGKIASFLTNMQYIRATNTILGIAHALTYYGKNISLDRLGTHLIEFLFGRMRRMSHDNNDSESLTRSLVKAKIADDLQEEYDLKSKPKGRVNFGGTKYDPEEWIVTLPELIVHGLIKDLNKIMKKDLGQIFQKSQIDSFYQLSEFFIAKSPNPPINLGSMLSGSQPYARNVLYNQKK